MDQRHRRRPARPAVMRTAIAASRHSAALRAAMPGADRSSAKSVSAVVSSCSARCQRSAGNSVEDLVEFVAQVAIFVECLDEDVEQAEVTLAEPRHRQAGSSRVFAQRNRRGGRHAAAVGFVVVAVDWRRAPSAPCQSPWHRVRCRLVGDPAPSSTSFGVKPSVLTSSARRRRSSRPCSFAAFAGRTARRPRLRYARCRRRLTLHRTPSKGLSAAFEQRVVRQRDLLDLLVQFERGQLQQPDGLLQLRRQREVLR